ncbi:uraH [Lepeophtheirus salmonis]|uniref:5-hydroxyisourate hydrolase n=1 Tax=Lepeophtheirus salmonis TaxID=72036 RepID=A0A0K2UPQ6_LEPSM|nr:5-hydroxyisourate hydrolase-like [Lepeophtheirus salmonis]CAB4056509.1 uraH [Lepeophtheirus salmonis]CAF2799361.1 uraH [Lepeophtheirus salmonis]
MAPKTHDNPLSSHVLDTSKGCPAEGIKIKLFKQKDHDWKLIGEKITNQDGRVSGFLGWEDFNAGLYKLHFEVSEYFDKTKTEAFFPYVEIVFKIKDPESHYHVPILLNPYGYTTYRGS